MTTPDTPTSVTDQANQADRVKRFGQLANIADIIEGPPGPDGKLIANIIVPAAIQAIFDKADADGEYAAKILPDAVQLTSRDGKTIFETVRWPEAARWARAAMAVISRSTPEVAK
jgi:hypothetical protein